MTLIIVLLAACSPGEQGQRSARALLVIMADSTEAPTPAVLTALRTATREAGVQLHLTESMSLLHEDSLRAYSSLCLLGMSLDSLSIQQQADVERYAQSGGGLLHLNTRITLPYTWPWYEHATQQYVLDAQHDRLAAQPTVQPVRNEEVAGPFQQHTFDGGRQVVARLTASELQQGELHQRLVQALNFAIGPNTYDYRQLRSRRAPEPNRFVKMVLDSVINEPMELAVLPDGKVLYLERRGKFKCYDPALGKTRLLHEFDVCTSGNYEDGMLGLAVDPDFSENNYIYLYYSPGSSCEIKSQYLSRFTFLHGDSLILASEKVLLTVDVQRETCCHSGGSITFDAAGNLYLSTGDNTSSKESDGYTPIDERPGRGPFDAQKSSANTHDLRGKILRITPTEYGTYTIPDGNLFPKDGSEGRPEIYVMGARNPFRISVDPKTGYVYWGDVGPDVGRDGRYGPQSYDEWNQAREPGYFGWPYFVGDNFAYPDRDFATDQVGQRFDPEHPINDSPHNYGARSLPPAQPAFIWYPKGRSPVFPMLGVGSNSAMAGPVYYHDLFPEDSEVRFPAYYDGKLFIYEWARSWVQVVSMNEAGDVAKIEPFLPGETWVKPIEMEFGPDGSLYMLEYGQNYFADNPEAKLVRITYAEGNRRPVAKASAEQTAGAAPFNTRFSASQSHDYDADDLLSYEWTFTGSGVQSTEVEPSFTFEEPGIYPVELRVTDAQGASSTHSLTVHVGNAPPEVHIQLSGNQQFFFDESRTYAVSVQDVEDAAHGSLAPAKLRVGMAYLSNRELLDQQPVEQLLAQGGTRYLKGKQLIAGSDCGTCHNLEEPNIGPSYLQVAERYQDDPLAVEYLADKIIQGGNGNWGEKIMAGHPQHTIQETAEMARYILSLTESGSGGNELPPTGRLATSLPPQPEAQAAYVLSAAYTDEGANGVPAITTREQLVLAYPLLQAEAADARSGMYVRTFGADRGSSALAGIRDGNWLAFSNTDLTSVGQVSFRVLAEAGGQLELRLNGEDGPLLARLKVPAGSGDPDWRRVSTSISPLQGRHDLYLVFTNPQANKRPLMMLDWISFHLPDSPLP